MGELLYLYVHPCLARSPSASSICLKSDDELHLISAPTLSVALYSTRRHRLWLRLPRFGDDLIIIVAYRCLALNWPSRILSPCFVWSTLYTRLWVFMMPYNFGCVREHIEIRLFQNNLRQRTKGRTRCVLSISGVLSSLLITGWRSSS